MPVEGVTFPRTTVQATFSVQEQDIEASIPGSEISVQLVQNGDFSDRYHVAYDGILGGTVKLHRPQQKESTRSRKVSSSRS